MDNPSPAPALIIHSNDPYNAEPSLSSLRASYLTAQADFYVRSHGEVPFVDTADYRLRVNGRVREPLTLALGDLRRRFDEHTVEAVMQCAGNRRADLQKVRPVSGDPWAAGAIGNARWTGVALAEVLNAVGADTGSSMHVAFSSRDECNVDRKTFRYGASIPMSKAMSPEVLLAYAMNGEPLAPEHGYPLRVVTPGFAGARSPKWLDAIEVRDAPSDNPIQAEDYKMLPPDISRTEDIDWSRGIVINDLPLNSAICTPAPHDHLLAGRHAVRGYAVATTRTVVRVDVSTDAGRTWRQAKLQSDAGRWSWTFWSLDIELPSGEHELVVRAWDEAGQTQPTSPDDVWNIKGYLSSAWHRVPITVC